VRHSAWLATPYQVRSGASESGYRCQNSLNLKRW